MNKSTYILGLTGGIGSGKSTVARFFVEKNVPVYNSDIRAKELMVENKELVERIQLLLGKEAYKDGQLNKNLIANKVFNSKELLHQLNALVHPAVFQDFEQWKKQKANHELLVKEAAILFESGSYKNCDGTLTVAADDEIRIQRVMKRDGVDRVSVLNRMKNQWTEEQRLAKANFSINNNGTIEELKSAFEKLYQSKFWLRD